MGTFGHQGGHAFNEDQRAYYEEQAKIKGGHRQPTPVIDALRKELAEPMSNDTLADMGAAEVLHALEAEIEGQPSVRIINYENARRIVKAALLAVFSETTKARWEAEHPPA
jgi:hypothetical protein